MNTLTQTHLAREHLVHENAKAVQKRKAEKEAEKEGKGTSSEHFVQNKVEAR